MLPTGDFGDLNEEEDYPEQNVQATYAKASIPGVDSHPLGQNLCLPKLCLLLLKCHCNFWEIMYPVSCLQSKVHVFKLGLMDLHCFSLKLSTRLTW